MQEIDQLKKMIDTLQYRRLGFKNQIEEFKTLQTEIMNLRERAKSEPEAQSKLRKLDMVINSSDQTHQQIARKAASLKTIFDQLGRQLQQILPDPTSAEGNRTEAKPKSVKKKPRSFV